jgi:hypothetical protein
MAHPRQLTACPGKARPLFFEIVSTLASLIFLATGALVLEQDAGRGNELGSLFAVVIGVFGLYGTVLGILGILDIACPPPSAQASTH